MSPELWLTFVVASLPVHFAPGPNNVLALSHGMARGYRAGHVGSLGRYPAYLAIFLAAGLGLGAVLSASPVAFAALRWIGAFYLAWTGYRLIRSARSNGTTVAGGGAATSGRMAGYMRREFLVAMTNPKAVIFATAFYAQFITPEQDGFPQLFARMVVLSLTLECVAAGCYAYLGAQTGAMAKNAGLIDWMTRGLGALLIGFGILLAAA